ncbi:MAG: hypothetical protein SVT52_07040 [Planctomycetota bacterium]|nr:hypothetical protein [Planctomycetota bacterium]
MPSRYETFDRDRLNLLPLERREHIVRLDDVLQVGDEPEAFEHPDLPAVANAVATARQHNASVVLLMGAHVIKQGLSRYVIDWIRRGWVSAVAMNGACAIHDYELARIGATSESVPRYIVEGQFGLWTETGQINDIVNAGNQAGLGFGEAVGKFIAESDFPHKDASIFAAAWACGVPATVHVGVGYDVIHEHPNFNGAAAGEASYRDFLILAKVVENLEGGAVLCCGTAVMGPEVYLKALSMARNVASRQGGEIRHFTSAVFDLVKLPRDLHTEAPKDSPEYYYRPFKTILVRTVRDGGRSYYIRGGHRATMPALHRLLADRLDK